MIYGRLTHCTATETQPHPSESCMSAWGVRRYFDIQNGTALCKNTQGNCSSYRWKPLEANIIEYNKAMKVSKLPRFLLLWHLTYSASLLLHCNAAGTLNYEVHWKRIESALHCIKTKIMLPVSSNYIKCSFFPHVVKYYTFLWNIANYEAIEEMFHLTYTVIITLIFH